MKIIKPGKINFISTCDYCECEFEFDKNDIKSETLLFIRNYVNCPCCGNRIYVKKGEKNETN